MRVAIDGTLLGRRFSGVEGSITNLVRTLADGGSHDYTLYTSLAAANASFASRRMRIVRPPWPVRFRPWRILWEQAALPAVLAQGGFHLLHAPGYVAPLRARVPVVATLYDLIALTHPELCTRSNRWHYRMLVPPSMRKAAIVIVPSQATRGDLVRFMPAAADRIRVIPLGVGDAFQVVRDADAFARVRRKYGLAERFMLFVGRTEPKKNLVRLIESYQLVRQNPAITHQLVIAGAASWDQANVVRAIRARGLSDAVVLTGFVPPDELPLLYNMADLFVFASLCEGFGLPPLEAMACGTPVIVSDRGALPETAGAAAVVTDPLAPARMAEAMQAVLTNRVLRAELIDKGLRHARRFTWARTAAATEAAYAEAARGKGEP